MLFGSKPPAAGVDDGACAGAITSLCGAVTGLSGAVMLLADGIPALASSAASSELMSGLVGDPSGWMIFLWAMVTLSGFDSVEEVCGALGAAEAGAVTGSGVGGTSTAVILEELGADGWVLATRSLTASVIIAVLDCSVVGVAGAGVAGVWLFTKSSICDFIVASSWAEV